VKIIFGLDNDDINEDYRCLLIRRLAKISDEHSVSKTTLKVLLGKSGVNSPAKAYLVQNFKKAVNDEMKRRIPYDISRDLVIVNILTLIDFLLTHVYPILRQDLKEGRKSTLQIKLSGDGRKSSRQIPFLLLTMSFLVLTNLSMFITVIRLLNSSKGRKGANR
jgi:hypothetical protein